MSADAQPTRLADLQMEWARSDPRLELMRAPLPDFHWSMEEIERTRQTLQIGVEEMLRSDMYERREMAAIEREKEHPLQNAWALVAMYGALDAFVEDLIPHARNLSAAYALHVKNVQSAAQVEPMRRQMGEEAYIAMMHEEVEVLRDKLYPKPPKKVGADKSRLYGTERWEQLLEGVQLGTRKDRPIPSDLDDALAELGALRHVIVHKANRVDERALRQAPTLARRYADGALVRMNGNDYRTYSAAVWAYGTEVQRRLVGPDRLERDFDLTEWREMKTLNV